MATVEQIRDAMTRAPYGFTVRLSDRREYLVRHRDFISVPASSRGRDLVIHDEKGTHHVDILHVVELEYPDPAGPQPAADQAEGSGA